MGELTAGETPEAAMEGRSYGPTNVTAAAEDGSPSLTKLQRRSAKPQ